VDPRTSLDDMEKIQFLTLSGLKLQDLGRPARGQLLYLLRYPGSHEVLSYISSLVWYFCSTGLCLGSTAKCVSDR
jgi:hypothetical protein